MEEKPFFVAWCQPWPVRLALLFQPQTVEPRENGFWFAFKTLHGRRYLVDILKTRGK